MVLLAGIGVSFLPALLLFRFRDDAALGAASEG